MTLQADVVSVLEDAGLTVYPLSVPERTGTYPSVVYQRISSRQYRSHADIEADRPRFQFSCWGKSYSDCVTTAEAVKSAMDLNRVDFILATMESEMDAKEVEPGYYRIILDYFVWG